MAMLLVYIVFAVISLTFLAQNFLNFKLAGLKDLLLQQYNDSAYNICIRLQHWNLYWAEKFRWLNGIQTHDLCDAGAVLWPTELWSHTVESRSICWAHVFPWKEGRMLKEMLYEVRCLKMRQLLKLSSKCKDHIFIWFKTITIGIIISKLFVMIQW